MDLTDEGDVVGKFDSESGEFRSRQLELRLNSLGDDDLKRFYTLTDAFGSRNANGHTCSKAKTNFGIVKTNSFTVTRRKQSENGSDSEKGTKNVLALFPSIGEHKHMTSTTGLSLGWVTPWGAMYK